jgi:predicted peroxiredoxin
MRNKLVVKVLTGSNDPERTAQAFTVAATAAASGIDVSLWLTSEASFYALPGKCEEFELPHSAALSELRDQILAAGSITLCKQCAQRRGISEKDLIAGIIIKGSASFVAEIMEDGVQVVVY